MTDLTEPQTEPRTVPPNFVYQTNFFDPDTFGRKVVLVGCGGIGGSVAPILTSFGIRHWELWDFDNVEPPNQAMSLSYGITDVGRPKVDVLAERLRLLGATDVTTNNLAVTDDIAAGFDADIVITGLDSMDARNTVWQGLDRNPHTGLLIDGRVGGHGYTLLTIEMDCDADRSWYEDHMLFAKEDGASLPCTGERGWIGPAVTLGPLMATSIVKHITDQLQWRYYTASLTDPDPSPMFVMSERKIPVTF